MFRNWYLSLLGSWEQAHSFPKILMGRSPLVSLLAMGVLAGCSLGGDRGDRSALASQVATEAGEHGISAHARILQSYGGVYEDAALTAYVGNIVRVIARETTLPEETYALTLLDSPLANAMALSDGRVYVTRGMLALAGDEAQLAGVLAHEMGHVNARHIASRRDAAEDIALLDTVVGGLLGEGGDAGPGLLSRSGLLAGYSRSQEDEADRLAVTYLDGAGYDPVAVSDVLSTMDAYSRHHAGLVDKEFYADAGRWFANHPETQDRVRRTAERAQSLRLSGQPKRRGRVRYFAEIDGLLYGTSPDQGYVRDQRFVHMVQRYQFEVPPSFQLHNTNKVVWAIGPEKVVVKFDHERVPVGLDPVGYLTDDWAASLALKDVRQFEIAGLASASARMRFQGLNTLAVVIAARPGEVCRFLIGVPPQAGARYNGAISQIVSSFRLMDQNDEGLGPLRIKVVDTPKGGTLAQVAGDLGLSAQDRAELELLNGLKRDEVVPARTLIKLIEEGPAF